MDRLKNSVVASYTRLTSDSLNHVFRAMTLALVVLTLGAMFFMGMLIGASKPPSELAAVINDIANIETALWGDMGETNSIVRSFYGLFHWFMVFCIWVSIQGAHIGAVLPPWLHTPVDMVIRLFPYPFVAYIAVQIVRLIEIAIGRDFIYDTGGKDR